MIEISQIKIISKTLSLLDKSDKEIICGREKI